MPSRGETLESIVVAGPAKAVLVLALGRLRMFPEFDILFGVTQRAATVVDVLAGRCHELRNGFRPPTPDRPDPDWEAPDLVRRLSDLASPRARPVPAACSASVMSSPPPVLLLPCPPHHYR
uniref:Uncharacterized protein n=2 Tax=Oryza sativa subsp. japonica TaxID=39947 RepID=A0A5S6R8N1_ORYSJ|nr:Unknown protein [Oryza sativa Japonica Group]AAM74468.1 Hypothetical protein [Oryza sativa Japonica Group]AAP53493.1 hypothetical protein LOC_Os10g24390 [Oryza sativa Japonica Group]